MTVNPDIGLAEGLAIAYFAVSIVGFLSFSFIVRGAAQEYGEKVPSTFIRWPLLYENAYDRAMKKRGRTGHARIWGAILLVNAILSLVAFRAIAVPAMEKSQQQSGRRR